LNSREEFLDIITYQIKETDLKWSQMFGIMEDARQRLQLDDYSLGQTSLEQVFLHFSKTTLYDKGEANED
jgi:ATP-binding cassette subfamily A (ABC1) protein 3